MNNVRLQKYIASAGFASRRKAEEIISQGRVSVNGIRVTEMGIKVTDEDIVEIDGKPISKEIKKVYIILNKPIGYVSTSDDQFGRATVLDLVSDISERIYPVGRLDYDTSGLLFLTNDGELTFALTHPRFKIEKVYITEVFGKPTDEKINILKNGVEIDGIKTSPSKIEILNLETNKSKLRITIHEGRNREVRKMFELIENPVISLKRIEEGGIELKDLETGKWRHLKNDEIKRLRTLCHLQ
ncbi:MAG: pseudouridine synthase [Clostridia bacterium]|jgi:23S rRNA pseudouridine2605 synthase